MIWKDHEKISLWRISPSKLINISITLHIYLSYVLFNFEFTFYKSLKLCVFEYMIEINLNQLDLKLKVFYFLPFSLRAYYIHFLTFLLSV